jgi:hypothetical protein
VPAGARDQGQEDAAGGKSAAQSGEDHEPAP